MNLRAGKECKENGRSVDASGRRTPGQYLHPCGTGFRWHCCHRKDQWKIEPSTSGRVMAGVFGLGLLAYGIYAHSVADTRRVQAQQSSEKQAAGAQSHPVRKSSERSPKNTLIGHWKNDSPQTRGITRLEIQQEGEA